MEKHSYKQFFVLLKEALNDKVFKGLVEVNLKNAQSKLIESLVCIKAHSPRNLTTDFSLSPAGVRFYFGRDLLQTGHDSSSKYLARRRS